MEKDSIPTPPIEPEVTDEESIEGASNALKFALMGMAGISAALAGAIVTKGVVEMVQRAKQHKGE